MIEVIVLIIVILFVIIVLSVVLLKGAHRISWHVICSTNLKGIGTALMVYSQNYDDNYPQLPGKGPWSKKLGFDYFMTKPDFTPGGAQSSTPRTITASWYLLVNHADVKPKSFVCPYTSQIEFNGSNPADQDLIELWDFGDNPYNHVSYAMHNPYGRFPADATSSASFAVAADMNPWFKDGDIVSPSPGASSENWFTSVNLLAPYWNENEEDLHKIKHKVMWANAFPHNRAGQNVLYGDGHTEWAKTSDVSRKHDNLMTCIRNEF